MNAAEALEFRPDFALLTVKTQDVVVAVEAARTHLTDTPIVTFQNGVRSDDLVASVLPPQQIVSAIASTFATYLTPGTVTIVTPGILLVDHPFIANDARVTMAAQTLRQALPTQVSTNIRGAHWLKLLINLNNALPALTDATVQEVFADSYLSQLGMRLLREGMAVVRHADVQLASLPEVSVALIRLLCRLPVPVAARLAAIKVRRVATSVPVYGSTLQSLRRNRPTEIEYLNGEIVRLGSEVGVPTPLNAAVVAMVRQIEESGRFWSRSDIHDAIAAGGGRLPAARRPGD
jgi:2-dehydropantoate 2-reductase